MTIADNLMQFFTTNGEPTEARALVAPINEKIFLETPMGGAGWKESYSEVKPGDKYTPLVKFGKEGTFSYYGQAYVKPVGVFTDAHCYSSCDIFAANMQDSGAAIIFGEDPQTGAGGANVVDVRRCNFKLNRPVLKICSRLFLSAHLCDLAFWLLLKNTTRHFPDNALWSRHENWLEADCTHWA